MRPVIAAETEAETGAESEATETATGIEVAGIGKETGPADDEAEAPKKKKGSRVLNASVCPHVLRVAVLPRSMGKLKLTVKAARRRER